MATQPDIQPSLNPEVSVAPASLVPEGTVPAGLTTNDPPPAKEYRKGDLGSRYISGSYLVYITQSLRDFAAGGANAGLNYPNQRYRGWREAHKFNLVIQEMAAASAHVYSTLITRNNALSVSETQDAYPTDEEVALLYHIRAQTRLREWLILRDISVTWYE